MENNKQNNEEKDVLYAINHITISMIYLEEIA